MKLRFLVFVFAVLAATSALAQDNNMTPAKTANAGQGKTFAFYLNPVVSRIGGDADVTPFAFLGAGNTSRIFGGVDFGAYLDFLHSDKLTLGADVRDVILHGNSGSSLNSFLLGVRISYKSSSASRWKPYIMPQVGSGRSRSALSSVHKTNVQYGLSAGVDYRLGRHIDLRAIELGYGSVTTVNSSAFNEPTGIGPVTMINVSTGFVFRFP